MMLLHGDLNHGEIGRAAATRRVMDLIDTVQAQLADIRREAELLDRITDRSEAPSE